MNRADDNNDPFAFLLHSSLISPSQHQIISSAPFVGDDLTSLSPTFSGLPVPSAGITMVSPPVSLDDGNDRNSTPPEESSLPSSDEQHKTLNVDVDAGTQLGFPDSSDVVNLGVDSQLGFSQVQPTKQADVTDGAQGAEIGVPEKETSDSCESSPKKLKLSENALGFGSVGVCSGDQLHNVEEGTGKCNANLVSGGEQMPEDCCKEIPMDESLGSGEDVENQFEQMQNEKSSENVILREGEVLVGRSKGSQSRDEVPEASGGQNEKPGLRVLPPSILGTLENGSVELGSAGEGHENKKFCVFDVLRILSENSGDGEAQKDLEGVSLLHVAKSRGMTFPRPMWWPEGKDHEFDVLKLL